MDKRFKVFATGFYLILLVYSILNFFSQSFVEFYIKSTYGYTDYIDYAVLLINLIIIVRVIVYLVKTSQVNKAQKTLWIIISLFFPPLLLILFWGKQK